MFYCRNCKEKFPVWNRECTVCGNEFTIVVEKPVLRLIDNRELEVCKTERLPSGFTLFDKVFNGGFLRGFLYFLHAEGGAGKTTFLLQICSFLISNSMKVIYFCFDENIDGIIKKCTQYGLMNLQLHIKYDNSNINNIEAAINEYRPDFVVIDSLQSFEHYKNNDNVKPLNRIKKFSQKGNFALIVVGEERKDRKSYLGSTSIGHIVDVEIMMTIGINEEVIISTPNKNRDTDDKINRCFFKRTPNGLSEILESETGYLLRHYSETAVIGLAAIIVKNGDDYYGDEITAAKKFSTKSIKLTITGMNNGKAQSLLAVLQN
jgi:DNA repair protein RadA/Sms